MPHLGQSYKNKSAARLQGNAQRTIDQGTHTVDIAVGAPVGRVRVNCFSARNGRIWGKVDDDEVAVFHLSLQLNEPVGHKLSSFELNVDFQASTLPSDVQVLNAAATAGSPVAVQLLKSCPAQIRGPVLNRNKGQSVEFAPEFPTPIGPARIGGASMSKDWQDSRSWRFEAKTTSEDGLLTGALYRWESNPLNPETEAVGLLHGGLALIHSGKPFNVRCHVTGEVGNRRSLSGFLGVFGTKPQEPPIWRVIPQQTSDDIKDRIEMLEAEMVRLNTLAPPRAQDPQVPSLGAATP